MIRNVFSCGHVSLDEECKYCKCREIVLRTNSVKKFLKNRVAINVLTGEVISSRYDLPGFRAMFGYPYDLYFTTTPLGKFDKYYFDVKHYLQTKELKPNAEEEKKKL